MQITLNTDFHQMGPLMSVGLTHLRNIYASVRLQVAVLMPKWEPHVHSLEKEIRAQMRVLKFL